MKKPFVTKTYEIYTALMLGVLIALNISPIPQDPECHNFADQCK